MGNRSAEYAEYLEIYDKAVRKASGVYAQAYVQMKEPLEEILFPIWRDGIHEIMKLESCACTLNIKTDDKTCFMDLDREVQIDLFNDNGLFSYQKFIEIIRKAMKMALH